MSVYSPVVAGIPALPANDWQSIAKLIEHTLLKPDATRSQVIAALPRGNALRISPGDGESRQRGVGRSPGARHAGSGWHRCWLSTGCEPDRNQDVRSRAGLAARRPRARHRNEHRRSEVGRPPAGEDRDAQPDRTGASPWRAAEAHPGKRAALAGGEDPGLRLWPPRPGWTS